MEHCEMCCNTQLKEKFHQVGLEELYTMYLARGKYPAEAANSSVVSVLDLLAQIHQFEM